MNAKELIETLASGTQIPTTTVRKVVNELVDTVQKQLAAGDAVTIPGLGKFRAKDLPARTRTTKAGETKDLPAGRVVKFKAKNSDPSKKKDKKDKKEKKDRRKEREAAAGE
jgi:DNA-binding protein HU-beta